MNNLRVIAQVPLILLVLALPVSHAQQATEVYIPIGESPGISAKNSLIGKIGHLDYATRRIELLVNGGARSVRVNDATHYYLDRSKAGQRNEVGSMQDCTAGQFIEVYVDESGVAEWIKIEAD